MKQDNTAEAHEQCPDCQGELHIKSGQSGPFLGCANYPSCHYTKPLTERLHIIQNIPNSECPQCQGSLSVKSGRFGLFIGCNHYPECHYIAQQESTEKSAISCPQCQQGQLSKRTSRYGKSFYACDTYPKCKYTVNFLPIETSCPKCDWPILIEKKSAGQTIHQCPKKECSYRKESV
ncbi:DNA topoisomerase family protein [Algicola sagamiensis]|uniref:DNA topoisomerase family protein n=1 Tax=Algicola sagamiensis TaxID=163869 RepID=UPI00036A9523|nr:topoisomerase DNA-binding C4 zinc finger domain-containing protein [Algicola sagamiensis]